VWIGERLDGSPDHQLKLPLGVCNLFALATFRQGWKRRMEDRVSADFNEFVIAEAADLVYRGGDHAWSGFVDESGELIECLAAPVVPEPGEYVVEARVLRMRRTREVGINLTAQRCADRPVGSR
jgi:hypothetical protein